MVSGPSGSEEGKWGEVVRTQEMGKPRITRKGAKSRKCRIDEGSKRKAKQKVSKHAKQGKDRRRSEGTGRRVRCMGKDARRERGARERAPEDVRAL